MTGYFLETTVVIHIADGVEPQKTNGETYIRANQPAETPFYALRELLAGHLRILCDAHNVLLAAENPAEAMLALHRKSPAEGRKKANKLHALADSMNKTFMANPHGGRQQMKREMLGALALRVNRLWRKAHKLKTVYLVQSLACFNDGRIGYGPSGELRGPGDSFNCITAERCAAAAYIYDNLSDLSKMVDALHPSKLDPKIADKNETKKRRKALKELKTHGPERFDKGRCRALGDAYFAAMCPAGSAVLTSNLEDYVPLCSALGKMAKEP